MKLSKNFSLEEFCKSQTASRLGISNIPSDKRIIDNLKALCHNVWQPARDYFGPIIISSGYRSPELNEAVGGSTKSQHILGEAADGEALRASNYELANWIHNNTRNDQVILEFYYPNEGPNSGWVHASYRQGVNRQLALTINRNGTYYGFNPR